MNAMRTAALVFAAWLGWVEFGTAVAAEKVKVTVGYQTWYSGTTTAIVIRALGPKLWEKFLPKDTVVEFDALVQGPVIINNMLAAKEQIGYLGDMPGIVATTKQNIADIRLVAVSSWSAGQVCHLLLVRKDAPPFKTPIEAVKWLNGKIVAAPKGGCTDLFFRKVMKSTGINPSEYQHQGVETIITNFRSGRIDGAVIPDFPMTRINNLVGDGNARLVATGHQFNVPDAAVIVMRKDFMDKHPEIAKGWLRMELFVQQNYMLNPSNWATVAKMAAEQNPGYSERQTWVSNFAVIPAEQGGSTVKQSFPFVFDEAVRAKMLDGFQFLHEIKVINVNKPRDGAIDDSLARQVVAEAKAKLPLGEIKGKTINDAPR